jgi:thiol-disulfide isomerase/thioredoxin
MKRRTHSRHRSFLVARSLLVLTLVGGGAVMAVTPAGASAASPTPASAAILRDISSIPMTEFNEIGAGSVVAPTHVKSQPALVANKLPEVLYVGAEFCPYCAAERWSLAIALLRFGTFKGLSTIASSPTDIYPSTATLDFRGAVFTSTFLNFTEVEVETVSHQPLMTLTKSENKLVEKYDTPKFVPGAGAGSIPFIDFGNRFLQVGSSYSPSILAGLHAKKIAGNLSDHSNSVTQSIVATANQLTADICSLTKQKPGKVCLSPGVESADSKQGLSH